MSGDFSCKKIYQIFRRIQGIFEVVQRIFEIRKSEIKNYLPGDFQDYFVGEKLKNEIRREINFHPFLYCLEGKIMNIEGKDREAFRTLVESLVQMTTFISRILLKLVELQKLIRLFCWNYAFYIITFQKIRQIKSLIRLFCWNRHFKL